MRVLLACVLLCAAAAVMAGAPTVDRSTALFDQNGGTLTINGSGFVRDNPYSQFLFILRNQNGDVWVSNPAGVIDDVTTTPRMGAAVDLGQGITDGGWRGCVPNSLSVNAAGTKATCTLEYIPDTVLEITGAGITSVEVDVFNSNGYLALPDPAVGVTVAVINNVNEQIFPGSSTVPPILHGITVIGVGFPAAGSIFLSASTFSLTLSSFDLAPTAINVIGGSDIQPQDNILTHAAAFVSVTGSGNIEVDPAIADTDAFTAGNCECWYDRNRIDCGFCGTALDAALPGTMTPNQALIAQLYIGSFSTVAPPMVIGPTQIATVSAVFRPPGSVTVDVDTTTEYFWNSPELVITGSGFATFPALHSNLILVPGALAGDPVDPAGTLVPARASPFKCIPTSVNADGTRLTCALQTLEPTATGTDVTVPLRVIVVSGESYSFTNDPVDGAIATQIGEITFVDTATIQSIAIDPRSAGIQQDARTLTLTSGNGLFGPSWPILYNDPALTIDTATLPTVVLNEVTLTGIESGASTVCTHQFSQNPEALVTGGPPLPRVCTILSATNSEIRLSLPPINEPVGTTVTALINYDFLMTATAAFDTDVQVVGVISPGAGVGGDPHFFGFLGEKYEFAGEAGEVYNILTDEEVQLNAVIGKWHFSHGEETIIKTLALKTASHRLLIDAGGNHLGTAGFSIQLDGVALEPNATDATSLGRDGWVRWNPLSEEDQFHLPLWERHNGVALVEVMLNDYHFQILSVEEGRDANGVWRKQPSRFLDFMCQMFDADRRPHGLFGQSAHLPAGKRSVEGWSLEGADSDYKVTEVFGDDFTFNKFQS